VRDHVAARYFDKAGTQDGGAFTAGVVMHQMFDECAYTSRLPHDYLEALAQSDYHCSPAAAKNPPDRKCTSSCSAT
jgi:hypothetical protein